MGSVAKTPISERHSTGRKRVEAANYANAFMPTNVDLDPKVLDTFAPFCAVDAGGAQKDIFPSLHTAGPTFLALFSFRHRARMPFRYTWPLVAFAAKNIIAATLYLRWHWLIDVLAGRALAITAATLAPALTTWESKRRAELGTGRAWPPV